MSRPPRGAILLALAALFLLRCGGGDGAGGGDSVSELEVRVARLEKRLAELPADADSLTEADVTELITRLDAGDAVATYRAVRELVSRGPEVHSLLLAALATGTPRQREGVAMVFASTATPEVLPELLAAHAEAERTGLRALLVTAIGRTGREDAAAVIAADLTHAARRVRTAAALALHDLGEATAAPELLMAALEDDPVVAPLALEALESLPDPAMAALGPQWAKLDPRQRIAGLRALAGCQANGTDAFVAAQLRDPSPLVALAAATALADRGSREGRAVALAWLSSDDPQVARAARETLDHIEAWPEEQP